MSHGIAKGFNDEGSITPQNLIAGEFPRVARVVTITGDSTLTRGSVLGKIRDNGHYCLSLSTASDGSEQPDAILGQDVDLSQGTAQGLVYLTGEFNPQALTLGNDHTLATIALAFRTRSLFLRDNQAG